MRVCVLMPWGRVGSNLMMRYLRTCLSGEFSSEPFNQIPKQADQLKWLKDFFLCTQTEDCCVKLSIRSLDRLNPVQAFFNTHDVHVIRMMRRNHLKTTISQIRAEKYAQYSEAETGQAKWVVDQADEPLPAITIETDILAERISIVEETQIDLKAMYFRQYMDVYYEDILADMQASLGAVAKFLGRDHYSDFVSPFKKATPDDLSLAIENYEEVFAWATSHNYGHEVSSV